VENFARIALNVYYLDDENIRRMGQIACNSLKIAEQTMNTIRERGFTFDVNIEEYTYAITIKRHIPHHRIIRVDYLEYYNSAS
jgi:hypothetical protein